jgi:iron-sulfur cluster assembly protein CyaY
MDDKVFDSIAEQELTHLRDRLDQRDPDELECELSMGVLTISFSDGERFVVNSHRAAGQIWMAAFKSAWHFTPKEEGGQWVWRTEKDELRETLSRVLSEKTGSKIQL